MDYLNIGDPDGAQLMDHIGCSGAPALDKAGNVLGVAVTGADSESTAYQTENHGIIPINTIKFV